MIAKMMEITTRIGCKLDCRFCPQKLLTDAYLKTGDRPRLMGFDVFRHCIDKLPANIDIHFSGMCEPWLNPDCTQMVQYAHQKGHGIHIFTTLVGMTQEDYLLLRTLPIRTLILHVPDAEGNSKFPMDPSYLELLKQVILDAVQGNIRIHSFSCHGTLHPSVRKMVETSGIRVNSQMYDRAGNVKEPCHVPPVVGRAGSILCKWCGGDALDKNVLLPDGTVLLCCMDYGMEYPLGNLLTQSFADISEGDAKKHYRRLMQSEDCGPLLCRTCHRSAEIGE